LYWLISYTFRYCLTVRPDLARSTLVLSDRDLVDTLVDPKRRRYGGPRWLLRLIWWLAPKPDLVIALDAPAELVQPRKREVSLEETARQREAYRALVGGMPSGHIVNADRPLEQVTAAVSSIILRFLATRTARRLGMEGEL
jgi:thymidylate kinase